MNSVAHIIRLAQGTPREGAGMAAKPLTDMPGEAPVTQTPVASVPRRVQPVDRASSQLEVDPALVQKNAAGAENPASVMKEN